MKTAPRPAGFVKLAEHPVRNEDETLAVAATLAPSLEPADVLSLTGTLGAGKTRFIQGLAHGLGVADECYVCSPTFSIIHEYPARLPLYHVDLYRIASPAELDDLGLDEYFEGTGVTAVEWFDRFPGAWPRNALEINIRTVPGEPDERVFALWGCAARAGELVRTWVSALQQPPRSLPNRG